MIMLVQVKLDGTKTMGRKQYSLKHQVTVTRAHGIRPKGVNGIRHK